MEYVKIEQSRDIYVAKVINFYWYEYPRPWEYLRFVVELFCEDPRYIKKYITPTDIIIDTTRVTDIKKYL